MCPLLTTLFWLATSTAQAADTPLAGVSFIRAYLLGQGEFSGLDILDIIVLVLLAAVPLHFFWSRRRNKVQAPGQPASSKDHENLAARQNRARAVWDRLGGQPQASRPAASAQAASGVYDERGFLVGAKAVFARILAALGRGDLADLDQFAAPEAMAQLTAMGQRGGVPEIVLLEAEVQEWLEEGGLERVRVRYRALLRTDGEQAAPEETRTLWRFVRRTGDAASHWKLEAVEE